MSTTTDSFNTSCSDLLGFQCSSCLTSYANEIDYKLHYKSEFHKYNILRKMVNLPIVAKQQFEKHQQEVKRQLAKPVVEEQSFYCATCTKKFSNGATLKQHLQTKKHLLKVSDIALDTEINELMIAEGAFKKPIDSLRKNSKKSNSDRGTPLTDNTACLFCSIINPSFEDNLVHMEFKHSFFIIDKTFCKSPKKLFRYLADKIFNKKLCIYYDYEKCGKFKTGQSVQSHMTAKCHCNMNLDYIDEYSRFYDFSEENEKVYARLQEKYKDSKGGVEFEFEVPVEKSEDSEGEEWEDLGSENLSEIAEENEGEMKENKEKKEKTIKEGKKNEKRVFKLRRAKVMDSGELLLPSGRIAGHKDFTKYYKQRPHINPSVELRRLSDGRGVYKGPHTHEERMMLKANPPKGGKLMLSDYNRYLMKERKKTHKRLRDVYRKKDLMWMKLGLTGNLTYQKYFRDSTMVFG